MPLASVGTCIHVYRPNTEIHTSLKPEMCFLGERKSSQIHSEEQPSHTVADKLIIIKLSNPWHLNTIALSTKLTLKIKTTLR